MKSSVFKIVYLCINCVQFWSKIIRLIRNRSRSVHSVTIQNMYEFGLCCTPLDLTTITNGDYFGAGTDFLFRLIFAAFSRFHSPS